MISVSHLNGERGSPKVSVRERVAGAMFQVLLECLRAIGVGEMNGHDEFPRHVFAGLRRSSGVVFGQPTLQIVGQTDIPFRRILDRTKQLNVHVETPLNWALLRNPASPPRYAGHSA